MKVGLKGLRVNASLTQTEVATALGISNKTLQSWEHYETFPNAVQLAKLSDLYHCKLDDIFLPDKLA